jgi:hypothetical protein
MTARSLHATDSQMSAAFHLIESAPLLRRRRLHLITRDIAAEGHRQKPAALSHRSSFPS